MFTALRCEAKNTPTEQLGIVPRAVMALFDRVAKLEGCTIRLSFLQIYNEKIYDLLNPQISVAQREQGPQGGRAEEFQGLRLRWDAKNSHFFVENLFQYDCGSSEEALGHYQQGICNKQVASTAMNVASSRSHTMLLLTLLRREEVTSGTSGLKTCKEVKSQLSLVDLAGSERSGAAFGAFGTSSKRFQEAVKVNSSLFVLRRVITQLSRPQVVGHVSHVPYRESKLTSLLQHSLGGNSFLVMFACLAPSERQDDENLSTLQYASQAACLKNAPVINLDPKDQHGPAPSQIHLGTIQNPFKTLFKIL